MCWLYLILQKPYRLLNPFRKGFPRQVIKGLKIELTCTTKSPLPQFAKEVFYLPLEKGGKVGFYKTMSTLL